MLYFTIPALSNGGEGKQETFENKSSLPEPQSPAS